MLPNELTNKGALFTKYRPPVVVTRCPCRSPKAVEADLPDMVVPAEELQETIHNLTLNLSKPHFDTHYITRMKSREERLNAMQKAIDRDAS